MNVQCGLIWVLTLYEFTPGYNITEATKNISYVKGESRLDYSIVTRWWKNFDDQMGSGKTKIMNSEVILKAGGKSDE